MIEELTVFRNFAIALFIGALVGIEREKRLERARIGPGGLRTFILFAQSGALSAWLAEVVGEPWLILAGVVAMSLILVAGYLGADRDHQRRGLTTEAAAIVVYLLGAATLLGHPEVAVALAIFTSGLLALKPTLHAAVGRVDRDELIAALKLLFASFIVLPLLPSEPIDPWNVINPYDLWLLVILVSSLSFAGYVAVRWLGPHRGTAVTGLAGGLVSSTVLTLTFARQSRRGAQIDEALSAGILLAWAVMLLRLWVIVAVVRLPLAYPLAAPVVLMSLAAGVPAAIWYRRAHRLGKRQDEEEDRSSEAVKLKNPFSLTAAIQFGLLFAVVLIVVEVARQTIGEDALYWISALAGATGVDAIALSLARLDPAALASRVAATAIVVAAVSNTVFKSIMVAVVAGAGLTRRIALGAVLVILAAILGLLLPI